MLADAIRDVTRRGGIVLDPFAGSGSTLIAAEKTGRQARCIEFEPKYCDVIVRRCDRALPGYGRSRSGETYWMARSADSRDEILAVGGSASWRQLATQFARGDRHARRDVFTYAAMLGVDLQGKEVIGEALGVTHQAILDSFVQRQQQTDPPAPEIRVKAPPDLIDDDITPPRSDQTGQVRRGCPKARSFAPKAKARTR
jgi:DNA methylase